MGSDGSYLYLAPKVAERKLSPHVATEIGSAGNQTPPLQSEESVGGMLGVVDMMDPKLNGTFWDWNGEPMPW
jgi:hypothetical protein